MPSPLVLRGAALGAALLLAGCAGVTPDGGFDAVAHSAQARGKPEPKIVRSEADERAVLATVRGLLAKPLGMDDAVHIALVNHPGLQASYWNVGIAQADLAQAARLQNPSFGFKRIAGGGAVEIERSLTFSLVNALTLPLSKRVERARFESAKLAVGIEIERHALDVRLAWIEAVAARQGLEYARRVYAAADAGAELTGRMSRSGNASKLDLAREQVFHAEANAALARTEAGATASRERLTRLLGLWGADTGYTLPGRLPELPAAAADIPDLERLAIERRLDVQAARQDTQALAQNLGLTRSTRFVNVLEMENELGYERKSETGEPRARGYEISLELPLFDWGTARVARAEATYMQSLRRVAESAVNARSQARERYLAYRAAYDLARHYRDQVLPLRKQVSNEVLLRYNGMLASTFDLLTDAREQAAAVNATIDAQKEFWSAHASLEEALGGPLHPVATSSHKEHAQ